MTEVNQPHAITGPLGWILRLEGLVVLICAALLYEQLALASWKLFFILFLIPDVSLLAYLAGKGVGAVAYNITHSYITPLLVGILFWSLSLMEWQYLVVIWVAHIGFDRALGYGLKYREGFRYTHLGMIGRAA